MNLFRFVKGLSIVPKLCGNIKGLQDPYRTPTTQKIFAERWKQKPEMVTFFADGSKISFEQAIVANTTDVRVDVRGMHGPTVESGSHVDQPLSWYPEYIAESATGIVDYVVGASPGPGVFVLGTHNDPAQRHYLELYKLGKGPLYCFYTPYHLCHFKVHNTLARAVLFNDAVITPELGPEVDVVATAKKDLQKGDIIDGLGHYMTYGQCENADIVHRDKLLSMLMIR
jgi:predicted homoserine dehydrogenase-like protein